MPSNRDVPTFKGARMIGLMELLLIAFIAVVIYGYVRMSHRKKK
jgi:hypothetical protein